MKKSYLKYLKLATLAGMLPFIYGCGSGGGTGSLLGFLFGGAGFGGGTIALIGGTAADATIGSGTGVATLVNPEPASMLLVGSGLVAMAYIKSKTNRHN